MIEQSHCGGMQAMGMSYTVAGCTVEMMIVKIVRLSNVLPDLFSGDAISPR
jgi:hypothetical protein